MGSFWTGFICRFVETQTFRVLSHFKLYYLNWALLDLFLKVNYYICRQCCFFFCTKILIEIATEKERGLIFTNVTCSLDYKGCVDAKKRIDMHLSPHCTVLPQSIITSLLTDLFTSHPAYLKRTWITEYVSVWLTYLPSALHTHSAPSSCKHTALLILLLAVIKNFTV